MIYRFPILSSTNDEAVKPAYREGDIIIAESQTAGRGQRGHTWHSNEGVNLTFSTVLTPNFLTAIEQFMLSEVVALSLVDTLAEYGVECRIKWTNDIYAGDKKIAGVLIEQSLAGEHIARTIVGIGLNVNQREFPQDLPNPTSIVVERGAECERREVLECFLKHLNKWYSSLERGEREHIVKTYNERLYRRDAFHTYAYPSGEKFEAAIRGVRATGHLCLEHRNGTFGEYAFKEVEFVIASKA